MLVLAELKIDVNDSEDSENTTQNHALNWSSDVVISKPIEDIGIHATEIKKETNYFLKKI